MPHTATIPHQNAAQLCAHQLAHPKIPWLLPCIATKCALLMRLSGLRNGVMAKVTPTLVACAMVFANTSVSPPLLPLLLMWRARWPSLFAHRWHASGGALGGASEASPCARPAAACCPVDPSAGHTLLLAPPSPTLLLLLPLPLPGTDRVAAVAASGAGKLSGMGTELGCSGACCATGMKCCRGKGRGGSNVGECGRTREICV